MRIPGLADLGPIRLPAALSARPDLAISLFQMINYSAPYFPGSLTEESAPAAGGWGGGRCNESENEQANDFNLVTRRKRRAMRSDVKEAGGDER